MEIKVYLTNLAKYNQGFLFGKWLELPLTDEVLEKELKEVLGSDEEYFCSDYEAPFKIEEFANLNELNEFAQQLAELDEQEQEKVIYLIDVIGCKREEALERCEDVVFYQGMSIEEVASELIEEGVFGELTDTIKNYIDYEKLARDLSMDGYYETDAGTFWYQ